MFEQFFELSKLCILLQQRLLLPFQFRSFLPLLGLLLSLFAKHSSHVSFDFVVGSVGDVFEGDCWKFDRPSLWFLKAELVVELDIVGIAYDACEGVFVERSD